MLHAGLIGLPSTGKTTLFRLLTRPRDNMPSTRSGRSDSTVAIALVPDTRLDRLVELFPQTKRVPATVVFADVVGHSGARSVLDTAPFREADVLLHVVRAFRAADIPHSSGTVDPARDARAMEDELILADLAVSERRLERLERDRKKGVATNFAAEAKVLDRCRHALQDGTPIRGLSLDPGEAKLLRGFQFLSAKPLLLVLNFDEADVRTTDRTFDLSQLTELTAEPATRAVPVCAKIELEIANLDPGDARLFLEDLGLREAGLDRIIRAAYDLLGYICFFTVGQDECRAWSIPDGTVAQVAAGTIHTDIERGFIRAEVVDYNLLIGRGSLGACREHGEVRLEGKDYVVQDGDVINFRFAT